MKDNNLAKYVLFYAVVISLATLIFAFFGGEKLGEKALVAFNNISLTAVSGVLGYLTAKNESHDDDDI